MMSLLRNALGDPGPRFCLCLLAYGAKESDLQSHKERSIVLLLKDQNGTQILIDPQWRNTVPAADHTFVEELISDFVQRAKSDTANLFDQTRFLSVGPVITRIEGSLPSSDPLYMAAVQRFVRV